MSDETKRPSGEQERLVITPGGPRPPEMVHRVAPGETVRVDEAGGAGIVADPAAEHGVRTGGAVREHGEGREANALGRAIRGSDVPALSGFVLTPGGYRPRSHVHQVQPGEALQINQDRAILRHIATGAIREIALPTAPGTHLPSLGSGWITYAYWNNGTGNTLTSFRTTWQVPPAPATQGSQTIFLFNGIQNNGSNYGILQPVWCAPGSRQVHNGTACPARGQPP
jgi:hypothetical protein